MSELRRCIRCVELKPISEFNIEHVFPAAIGGIFTTDKICTSCNSLLNKKVDEPFVKSNFVIEHRNIFELNRDSNRPIPSVIKGKVKNAEGDDVLTKFENGQLRAEFIDKFESKVLEDGRIECKLTIDIGKLDKQDEIIKKHLGRLSKDWDLGLGTDYSIANIQQNQTEPFKRVVEVANSLFVKMSVKIAYEFGCLISEKYIEDETAKMYSSFLVADSWEGNVETQLDSVVEAKSKKYNDRFELLGLPIHQHAILIDNVEGEGVYAAVKIFNYVYPLLLTRNNNLFPKEDFLLVNDVVTGVCYSSHFLDYQLLNFSIDLNNISEETKENIQTIGIEYLEKKNDSYWFYSEKGKVKYESLYLLCQNIVNSIKPEERSTSNQFTLNLVNSNIFIKTTEGLLVRVLSLSVNQRIVIERLPK